jgi:hypothetical protein
MISEADFRGAIFGKFENMGKPKKAHALDSSARPKK